MLLVLEGDDRDAPFQHTRQLVPQLWQRVLYYGPVVFPNDTHKPTVHSQGLYTFDRMERFLMGFSAEHRKTTTASGDDR